MSIMMALDGKTIIKEEIPDKEVYEAAAINTNRRSKSGNGRKDNCRTPDSPESARAIAPRSPMSPQIHHSSLAPPQRPHRNASSSPVVNGATTTPPPSSQSNSIGTSVGPASSSSASAITLSHLEQTRALCKIRKFLGSLVQFGQETHPEASDRIRALVLSLASGGISIEELRVALLEATNLPFRSYVIPFLKSHIPLLQREIAALARANNQTTLQYVTTNDSCVMEFSHSPSDHPEIFLPFDPNPGAMLNGNSMVFKRRPSDTIIDHHNGVQEWNDYIYPPAAKRHLSNTSAGHTAHISSGGNIFNQPALFEYSGGMGQNEGFGILLDKSSHRDERDIRSSASEGQRINSRMPGGGGTGPVVAGGEEEWKNIHTMLNCISAMVDKTKRAITILQQRGVDPQQQQQQQQQANNNYAADVTAVTTEIRRQTEEKVAEFKRNAEEAVNQVKRQAVIEIQRAVASAENRAADIMAQERLKMEKFFVDMNRHTGDRDIENKSPSLTAGQSACWNCGRKANETCSGCNMARYCGAFCQHKDWEHHHQICGNARTSDGNSVSNITPKTLHLTASTNTAAVVAAAAAAAAAVRGQLTRSPPNNSQQTSATQPNQQQPPTQTPSATVAVERVSQQTTNNIPNGVTVGSGGTK